MDNSTYLQASVAAYDSRATIYWLFELLFRSVKSKSEFMGLYTNSHYETQTVGLDLLRKNGLLTKEDIHLYGVVRDMFLLLEYDGKQYAWEEVAPLVAPSRGGLQKTCMTYLLFSKKRRVTTRLFLQ